MGKFLCKFLGRFVPKKGKNIGRSSLKSLQSKEKRTSDLEIIEDIEIEKTPMNKETFELAYANGTRLKDGSKLLFYEQQSNNNVEIHKTDKDGLFKIKISTLQGGYQYADEKKLLGQIPCVAGSIKKIENDRYKYVRYYYDDAIADSSNPLMSVAKIFNKDDIVNLINSQGIVF